MIARGKYSSISRKFIFEKNDVKCFGYNQLQQLSETERENIFFESLNIADRSQQTNLSEEKDFGIIFCSIHFWLSQSLESGEMVSALEFTAVVAALAIWRNSSDDKNEINSGLREKVF